MSKPVTFDDFCKRYDLEDNQNSREQYADYLQGLEIGNQAFSEDITQKAIEKAGCDTVTKTKKNRFRINADNQMAIVAYIRRKLSTDPFYLSHLGGFEEANKAESAFNNMSLASNDSAAQLMTWCDDYLTPKQFTTLRAAIRRKESRIKNAPTSIELPRDIDKKLKELSNHLGMSKIDYLCSLIEDKHHALQLHKRGLL